MGRKKLPTPEELEKYKKEYESLEITEAHLLQSYKISSRIDRAVIARRLKLVSEKLFTLECALKRTPKQT
jgi:hypothetical protein